MATDARLEMLRRALAHAEAGEWDEAWRIVKVLHATCSRDVDPVAA